ncbi:MAG: helix-turn-helix transcriptional regulator, partial [Acidobacteria bacterium Pan2503]|nr:helix-turn-helix transcriptional regulator [Candidatus Acidoferrum panamensis]
MSTASPGEAMELRAGRCQATRNSVYQTIDALVRAGLIRVRETAQEENRPERTIYEATERG